MPRANRHFLPGHLWHLTHPAIPMSPNSRSKVEGFKSKLEKVEERG